ncbi:MAG: hypothetical protein IPM96_14150 [Ignavibacteria bacterium]|nr:hypothetical protein [Ignavibacteria bacterium]
MPEKEFSIYDRFNGNATALGIGHSFINECYEDNNILNYVIKLLNLPTNTDPFTQTIKATPPSLSFFHPKDIILNNQYFIDTANHIEIISPENGNTCIVDENVNLSFSVDDTTGLKYVRVSFQGEEYFDSVKAYNYNFNIQTNGNELDSSLLSVSAFYFKNDSLNFSYDNVKVFIKNNSNVMDFSINTDFYYLIINQLINPEYKTIFSNYIYEGKLKDINAIVDNPDVVFFNNTDKSFKAISSGETFAIVSNGSHSDTIYFSVNGELLVPSVTVLNEPVDSAIVSSSNLKFNWNIVEYAGYYEFQLAKDINFSSIFFEDNTITDSNIIVPSVEHSNAYYWRVRALNSAGAGNWSSVRTLTALQIKESYLYINMIPQGMYNETTQMLNRKDTVKAYLVNINPPYSIIDSSVSQIDSISFQDYLNLETHTPGHII